MKKAMRKKNSENIVLYIIATISQFIIVIINKPNIVLYSFY